MTKILRKASSAIYVFFFGRRIVSSRFLVSDSAQMHLLVAVTTPALLVLQQCVLSTLMRMRWVYRSLFQNCYWFSDSLSYYGGGGCYSPSNPSSYYTYGYELKRTGTRAVRCSNLSPCRHGPRCRSARPFTVLARVCLPASWLHHAARATSLRCVLNFGVQNRRIERVTISSWHITSGTNAVAAICSLVAGGGLLIFILIRAFHPAAKSLSSAEANVIFLLPRWSSTNLHRNRRYWHPLSLPFRQYRRCVVARSLLPR